MLYCTVATVPRGRVRVANRKFARTNPRVEAKANPPEPENEFKEGKTDTNEPEP